MELLMEILFDVYGELMFLIIPEKNRSKKIIWISRIIAVAVFLAVVSLGFFGIVLIADYNNLWGILPITVAVIISLSQIIAGIILYRKHH